MRIFGISNHGLGVIGALVCVLWGVIFMEKQANLRAEREYHQLQESFRATPAATITVPHAPPLNVL